MGCSASSSPALVHSDVTTGKDCAQVMSKLANKDPASANSKGIHISTKATKDVKQTNKVQNESIPRADKKDSIESCKSLSTRDKQPQGCYSPELVNETTHTPLLVAPAVRPGTPQRNSGPCQNPSRISGEDRSDTNVPSLPPVESLPAMNRPHSVASSKASEETFKNQTNAVKSNTSHHTGVNSSLEYWKAPTISPLTVQPLPPVFSKIESKSIIFIEESRDVKYSEGNKMTTASDNIKTNSPTSPTRNHHKFANKTAASLEISPTDPHVSFDSSADSAQHNNRCNLHHIRRHSHHYHHHHNRKLSVSNCSRSITPEKTIKITTKDERAQFVFKTVRSRDDMEGGSGDTRDILIQTDVISLNENNEKMKKKLLIKIGKFGSKSSPACIPVPKPTPSVETLTSAKRQDQAGDTQKEQDIVADVLGDGEGSVITIQKKIQELHHELYGPTHSSAYPEVD